MNALDQIAVPSASQNEARRGNMLSGLLFGVLVVLTESGSHILSKDTGAFNWHSHAWHNYLSGTVLPYEGSDAKANKTICFIQHTALSSLSSDTCSMAKNNCTRALNLIPCLAFPSTLPWDIAFYVQPDEGMLGYPTSTLETLTTEANTGQYGQSNDQSRAQIEALAGCDTAGQHPEIKEKGYIIDSNGLRSYGLLQFQSRRSTTTPNATASHSKSGITTTEECIAYRMIKEDPRNWRHWLNCTLRLRIFVSVTVRTFSYGESMVRTM